MSANFAGSSATLYHAACIDVKKPLTNEPKPLLNEQSSTTTERRPLVTEQQPIPTEQPWRHLLPSRSIPRSIFTTKPPWPNPEESIGVECSPLGKNKCWEAIGPVREISGEIYRETKAILD